MKIETVWGLKSYFCTFPIWGLALTDLIVQRETQAARAGQWIVLDRTSHFLIPGILWTRLGVKNKGTARHGTWKSCCLIWSDFPVFSKATLAVERRRTGNIIMHGYTFYGSSLAVSFGMTDIKNLFQTINISFSKMRRTKNWKMMDQEKGKKKRGKMHPKH